MSVSEVPPLMLCMEKTDGQEVALQIQPSDDFHTFLLKARSLLGYDVDLNSITHNQPVALTDNVYQFLLNADQTLSSEIRKPMLPTVNTEDLYILDDGTQIRASQIHFDNEDPPVDLSAEKIPFVKYSDFIDDVEAEENIEAESKLYNIVESPVRFPKDVSNGLIIPFKLVSSNPFKLSSNSNTTGFEGQYTKYLEVRQQVKTYATLNTVTNRNKSPRSLIRDNFKSLDDNFQRNNDDYIRCTREDILNMFKDAPVSSGPCENQGSQGFPERRRHARKSDPSRLVHKTFNKPITYVDVDGVLISETESQNCFICSKFVDNNREKLYLFDNEDQRLHRSSPQKKLATQLKIICEQCLESNFKPCRKSPNQSLNVDEFLVIRNNQQYIFQKTNSLIFNVTKPIETKSSSEKADANKKEEVRELFKVEIGSEGEIISQSIQKDKRIERDEGKASSSDVEIIENEPEFDDIDNLEHADEEVIEFLGKYQCDDSEIKELKCRFCEVIFGEISEVIDHGNTHKHITDDGEVFPCPLCDYGYANFKWLKGHLKAAHGKPAQVKSEAKSDDSKDHEIKKELPGNDSPPIARRTRSATRNDSDGQKEDKKEDSQVPAEPMFEIKTEVKQETLDSSDEEIWIVQAADEVDNKAKESKHKCDKCNVQFSSADTLTAHKFKCRRPARKKNNSYMNTDSVCVPTQEDFIRRAQGRIRSADDCNNRKLLVEKPRKRKTKEPSSDPQIVTCHDCNESFTSKVRLKFHMQFHDTTSMLTPEGDYACTECSDAKFPTETALFDHVHFQHNKQRRWQCPITGCGKTFYLSLEGDYACTECSDAKFPTETALFDHVHFQHNKQRRWQCPITGCGKTFYLRATLTKHSRTHTDTRRYVCGTCGKRFLDKQTLDEHGVTHLRIKPFQCHICLKQLTRRSRLRMHLRAHEEELRPRLVLVCAVCSRAFRDVNDVQEHVTRSPECVEAFASELKEEETVTVQLSPTSGLVRHAVQIVESPKLSKPIRREASGPEADALLSSVPDEAQPIIRCVEIEKAFRCEYCEDVFYSESGLNSHRVIHKNVKNPFICHICKVAFATYSRCTTHKTTHGFYKRSLAMAKQQGAAGKQEAGPSSTGILGYGDFPVVKHFLCEDCGRSYLHWTYLQVHRRMKHANDNFTYKCGQCDVSFVNSWSLSYHRKKQHGKGEHEDGNGGPKTREREDYRIPCRDCDQVLPNKTALYKHRKKEHSDMSLRMNSKPETSTEEASNVYWCGVCGRRYLCCAGLNAHARTAHAHAHATHTPGQQYNREPQTVEREQPCSACSQSPSPLPCLVRTRCGRGAHACYVCGHVFRTMSMLTEHSRVHSGERPYPCDICGVAFRRSTAMRNHRLIHSGIRAWACARCPKRFRIRSDLRTHLRLKHPARMYVIEVPGLNPSPEEVMERLSMNKIPHDKVIEITKMAFPKNTTSIIPCSARALEMLSHVPQTQVACSRHRPEKLLELYQPTTARRGRGISKNPRKPKILQRGTSPHGYSYTMNMPPATDRGGESSMQSGHNYSYTLSVPTSTGDQRNGGGESILQSGHTMSYTLNVPASERGTDSSLQGGHNISYTLTLPTTSEPQQQRSETISRPPNVPTSSAYPSLPLNMSQQDLSDLNMQLLLRDGVLMNGNQMMQLQLPNLNNYNC